MNKINVILIEPSPIIREGFKHIIENAPDITLTFSTDKLSSAQMHFFKADVIILNPRIVAGENMQQTIREIQREINKQNDGVAIVALHTHYESVNTMKLFDNVIELECEPSTLLEKIRSAQQTTEANHQENCELSSREREVLIAVAQGMTNKEIADKLNISIYTVIAHRKNITGKTGIKTISGFTLYAMTNGLL